VVIRQAIRILARSCEAGAGVTISADTLKRRSIYELKAMDVDAEILIARTKEIRGYV
jgi:hypothetical protein